MASLHHMGWAKFVMRRSVVDGLGAIHGPWNKAPMVVKAIPHHAMRQARNGQIARPLALDGPDAA